MNALDELLGKYRDPVALHRRQWKSEEVCRAVCALSLIVRHYFFGYHDFAIVAATLLEQSEPLEQLCDEALCILDALMREYADDRFIAGLHSICMEHRRPARRRQRRA